MSASEPSGTPQDKEYVVGGVVVVGDFAHRRSSGNDCKAYEVVEIEAFGVGIVAVVITGKRGVLQPQGLSREACGLGVGVYALEGEQQSLGTLGAHSLYGKGHHETVQPDEHEGGILDEIHIVGSDRNAYLAFHAVGFGECCGSQESVGGYHLFFFFYPRVSGRA